MALIGFRSQVVFRSIDFIAYKTSRSVMLPCSLGFGSGSTIISCRYSSYKLNVYIVARRFAMMWYNVVSCTLIIYYLLNLKSTVYDLLCLLLYGVIDARRLDVVKFIIYTWHTRVLHDFYVSSLASIPNLLASTLSSGNKPRMIHRSSGTTPNYYPGTIPTST